MIFCPKVSLLRFSRPGTSGILSISSRLRDAPHKTSENHNLRRRRCLRDPSRGRPRNPLLRRVAGIGFDPGHDGNQWGLLNARLNDCKGSFTLAAAVCGFRSGLRQRRDRNFSISAEQHNHLPQTHAENAVM